MSEELSLDEFWGEMGCSCFVLLFVFVIEMFIVILLVEFVRFCVVGDILRLSFLLCECFFFFFFGLEKICGDVKDLLILFLFICEKLVWEVSCGVVVFIEGSVGNDKFLCCEFCLLLLFKVVLIEFLIFFELMLRLFFVDVVFLDFFFFVLLLLLNLFGIGCLIIVFFIFNLFEVCVIFFNLCFRCCIL